MELLLNLVWLLLAVPAYWLWRGSRTAGAQRTFSALQCLLALGCVLVVLFPVVSATDDLQAMRAEIEESPTSKRGVRQSGTDRAPAWNAQLHVPAALVLGTFESLALNVGWTDLRLGATCPLPTGPVVLRPGRAPPALSLA